MLSAVGIPGLADCGSQLAEYSAGSVVSSFVLTPRAISAPAG